MADQVFDIAPFIWLLLRLLLLATRLEGEEARAHPAHRGGVWVVRGDAHPRQETVGLFGIPIYMFTGVNDSEGASE